MSKYLIGAAAAALVVIGATSGAMASGHSDPDCGTLPNANWSWEKTVLPPTETTETTVGDPSFSGNSGNANAEVTTTKTTTPGGIQCTAINPGQEIHEGNSHTIGGGDPIVETTSEVVKVCQNTGNQSSTALVDGVDCTNPRW